MVLIATRRDHMHIGFQSGRQLCRLAMKDEMPLVTVTPISEQFIVVLAKDVLASIARQKTSASQQNNRDLIRTVFAAIEGLVWVYRNHIVEIATDLRRLTPDEQAALSEISYQVTDTGKISKSARHIPLSSMIRLVTRIAATLDPALLVRFDNGSWASFREAVAIRNRITHPKSKADLGLSPRDVETCIEAFYWLFEVSLRAMARANAAFSEHTRELNDLVQALKAGDSEATALYAAALNSFD
jgi:hypothetical protein